jgi:polyhydroxyalkanoic acid synthase PhaR subunit
MPETNPDPFAAWRDWLSTSERQWNSFLNQAMSTDEFGQAMGRMMDVYLGMQKNMNEVMGRYFTALNVPTRTDVLSLANRLSEIEERLGSIEDAVRTTRVEAPAGAEPRMIDAPAAARPPRTKKPASQA